MSSSFPMSFTTGQSLPQTDPPRSPRETLPTMYDLPSEFPEEPGLPDEFHDLQPQLLSRTLCLADYSRDHWFTGSDLNVYFDVHNPLRHKRPDWFLAVGVPRLYDGHDLRRSYVVWQEGQSPSVVVEFLCPNTERGDLGQFYKDSDQIPDDSPPVPARAEGQIPEKFEVYERYLRVPHYIVYSRYTGRLRYFKLVGSLYQEQPQPDQNPLIWLDDLNIGLGLWPGKFEGATSLWLRWCGQNGEWLLTDTEQAQQQAEAERQAAAAEHQARQQAQEQAERLAERLRELGIDPVEM